MARKVPEINASTQADIAFLLLIFYLVSTTMNVDSGIYRMLPPWSDKDQTDDANKVKDRNVLKISINTRDELLVGGKLIDVSQLANEVKTFISNPANDEKLSEKTMQEIDGIGEYAVSKGVISLLNSRETGYEMYVSVQNELTRAVNELRDVLSMEKFGKKFADLDSDSQKPIMTAIPNAISEAEPLEKQ